MNFRTSIVAGVAASLLALPAFAHHSFAVFDQTKTDHVAGTVKQYEWINPHVWLEVVVTAGNGSSANWSFEAGAPGQLAALGWRPDNIHIGDKVDVGFRPMKDGSRGGQIMSVTLANGEKVCSNRGCNSAAPPQ